MFSSSLTFEGISLLTFRYLVSPLPCDLLCEASDHSVYMGYLFIRHFFIYSCLEIVAVKNIISGARLLVLSPGRITDNLKRYSTSLGLIFLFCNVEIIVPTCWWYCKV